MASDHLQSSEQMALLNNVILSNIFKYSDTRDLQSSRLVCKAWNDAVLAQLRRTVPLIVHQGEEDDDDDDDSDIDYVSRLLADAPTGTAYIKRSVEQIVEYLLLTDTETTRFRHSTVVLQGWDLASLSYEEEDFLETCGDAILDLHLINCQITVDSLNAVLEHTPNVEILTFDDKYLQFVNKFKKAGPMHNSVKSLTVLYCYPETGELKPVAWMNYLRWFPNLEKVVLGYRLREDGAVGEGFTQNFLKAADFIYGMDLMRCLESHKSLDYGRKQIKHLDISRLDWPATGFLRYNIRDALTLEYENNWMPLTTLKIDIGLVEEPNAEISVPQIFNNFAATLETLVVYREPVTLPSPPVKVPEFGFLQVMGSLTTLKLIGNVAVKLQFLRLTPNLKKLVITPMHRSKYVRDLHFSEDFKAHDQPFHRQHPQFMNLVVETEQPNADLVLGSLTELEVGYQLEGPASVILLGKWMPNLEQLKIPVTPGIFTEICRQWGNSLRKLELQNPSVINDEVITGLGNEASASSSSQLIPNVTWLKHLQSFHMEHPHYHLPFECDHQIPQITERSILHGFANMEGLQDLRIFVTHELCKECLETLETLTNRLKVVADVVGNCKCNS